MKNQTKIILPLVIALSVIGGMFLGRLLSKPNLDVRNFSKIEAVLKLINNEYVDSVDIAKIEEDAIPIILNELDPHSSYIPVKDFQGVNEEMTGSFAGVGVQFSIQNDTILVVDVISGGPSQKLGILPGDRIAMVNDSLLAGVKVKNETVMNLLRGEKGSEVKVGIVRKGIEGLIWFDIKRDDIPLYSVDVNYMINDSTGYIKVSRFAMQTHAEMQEGLSELKDQGATQFIIDLRGNPGGSLRAVTLSLEQFLPRGANILYTEGNRQERVDYISRANGLYENENLIVLIDEYSASASEIFAGAIQDNDRGVIMGRRSFGKGLVQTQIPFNDGSAVRLTVARYYIPSKRSIQKPYVNGNDEYHHDIINRIEHGELSDADSIHFNDSLRYETLGGRTVYGGGGIMPDIFIPVDTTGYSNYFSEVVRKGAVYRFALDYTDKNRSKLTQFSEVKKLKEHLKQQHLLTKFAKYADNEHSIKPDTVGLKASGEIIETQIMAYIGRNILSDKGFYPIIHEIDHTLHEAITLSGDKKQYYSILSETKDK